jgi:hypothetical protein
MTEPVQTWLMCGFEYRLRHNKFSDKGVALSEQEILEEFWGSKLPHLCPSDFGLTRWDDFEYLSGVEIRYYLQQKVWKSEGVPVVCPTCGGVATDIFYLKGTDIPAIFYCRWAECHNFWTDISIYVPKERIREVRVSLGLEKDQRSTYERALDNLK